jgi:hypothetical protein
MISSPIPKFKKRVLGRFLKYYLCNQNALKMITHLFLNLEYVELSINDLEIFTILIIRLSHLIYASIYYEAEALDKEAI